jgi:hypothetical protein
MAAPSRMIWLTAVAVMAMADVANRLSFGTFCLIVICAVILVKVFRPESTGTQAKIDPEPTSPDAGADDEVLKVRRVTLVALRNALLQQHNTRQADKTYTDSMMAKNTNRTIAALNGVLARKIAP